MGTILAFYFLTMLMLCVSLLASTTQGGLKPGFRSNTAEPCNLYSLAADCHQILTKRRQKQLKRRAFNAQTCRPIITKKFSRRAFLVCRLITSYDYHGIC